MTVTIPGRRVVVGAVAAFVVLAAGVASAQDFPTATPSATPTPNTCVSGKNKCVSKGVQGLLKCHIKAVKKGVSFVNDATVKKCVGTARAKFDGTALVPPDPSAGCVEALEVKQNITKPWTLCRTENDTAALGQKVTDFVDHVVHELDPSFPTPVINLCTAAQEKCVFKGTSAILKCHELAVKYGSDLDQNCQPKILGKLDECLTRAEAREDLADPPTICLAHPDKAALAGEIEAFVADVLCTLRFETLPCIPAAADPPAEPTGDL